MKLSAPAKPAEVGERAVRAQGQHAVPGSRDQFRGEGVAVEVEIVGQHVAGHCGVLVRDESVLAGAGRSVVGSRGRAQVDHRDSFVIVVDDVEVGAVVADRECIRPRADADRIADDEVERDASWVGVDDHDLAVETVGDVGAGAIGSERERLGKVPDRDRIADHRVVGGAQRIGVDHRYGVVARVDHVGARTVRRDLDVVGRIPDSDGVTDQSAVTGAVGVDVEHDHGVCPGPRNRDVGVAAQGGERQCPR